MKLSGNFIKLSSLQLNQPTPFGLSEVSDNPLKIQEKFQIRHSKLVVNSGKYKIFSDSSSEFKRMEPATFFRSVESRLLKNSEKIQSKITRRRLVNYLQIFIVNMRLTISGRIIILVTH
jgi:hypothetical protein